MYAFEGIGVILPIKEITEKKEDYFKIFAMVVGGIGIFYIFFSEYMIFGYGAEMSGEMNGPNKTRVINRAHQDTKWCMPGSPCCCCLCWNAIGNSFLI